MTDAGGNEREARLLDAVGGLAADLELTQVLQRIVAAACVIADARYGALGVIGDERLLTEFVHEGIDDATVEAIGHLPEGHGVLGLLIDEPRPIRLPELAQHAASLGFPPHHPPMHSFLGVPVLVRGEIFGNLYLCEKRSDAEFSERDERLVRALAAAAGSAIANTRMYEARLLREQSLSALQSISTALLSGSDPDDVIHLVAAHAKDILDADNAIVLLPVAGGEELFVAVVIGDAGDTLAGTRIPHDQSIAGDILRSGSAVASADAAAEPTAHKPLVDALGAGPMLFVALLLQGEPFGTLELARYKGRPPFDASSLPVLQSFATQASLALEYARAQREMHRLTLLEDEQRIARDLHDSVIQEIFAIGLSIQGAALMERDPAIAERLQKAVADLDGTISGIRTAIFDLSAARLDGVRAEVKQVLSELSAAHTLRTQLRFDGIIDGLVTDEIRPHLIATLREAISNAGRHARATTLDVFVEVANSEVVLRVSDNGIGMPASLERRSGLANMADRADALGGSVSFGRGAKGGAEVVWRVPLA